MVYACKLAGLSLLGWLARARAAGLLDGQCDATGGGDACLCSAEEAPGAAPSREEHVLIQLRRSAVDRSSGEAALDCTAAGSDPFGSGSLKACCAGSEQQLGNWNSDRWYYKCVASDVPATTTAAPAPSGACTASAQDPYFTGSLVECCEGTMKELGNWTGKDLSYLCKPLAPPAPLPAPKPKPGPPAVQLAGLGEAKVLQWNVHYSNKDTAGLSGVVALNRPDIVGFCELTTSMNDMAGALSAATGRSFRVQPGRNGWQGFGTDIFYDSGKWQALEGGVTTAQCSSRSGDRTANWVVLQERATSKTIIVGGTHTSYCAEGCDELHECELKTMYDQFEKMQRKYHGAGVLWMGDINRNMGSTIMQNVLKGQLGRQRTFQVVDLAQVQGNTYFSGGPAIDHILGESGSFEKLKGGRTDQGVTGQHLFGADHFPIYALVKVK
mmetsp:Transcript_13221/g.33118  ORF Transcript_13221/g.33118 Transcript_13221/m.33118 type:complete len:440 (+) Transcript_13221:61-1380(+)